MVVSGLDYDSIYDISRSQRSNASVVSDLESVYSRSTTLTSAERAERARAKQRKLDVAPQFTSGAYSFRLIEAGDDKQERLMVS